jgi:hypothetical protein
LSVVQQQQQQIQQTAQPLQQASVSSLQWLSRMQLRLT